MSRKPKNPELDSRPTGVVLEAFGDLDDHLRLSTLIADVVTTHPDANASLRGVARRLTDERGPRSWRDRRTDFIDIARVMPRATIVLRDPDAFAETFVGTVDWDDAALYRERKDFFECLLDPIERGAIELERTAPDPRFSRRLPSVPWSPTAAGTAAAPYASLVGPDALGALGWLIEAKYFDEAAIDELIDEGVGPDLDRHLLLVTYDHLPPGVRAAAWRLAVLRGEQALNGAIGPFPVVPRSAEAAVTKDQIASLLACGFLRRATRTCVRMPRIVRDLILARADAADPDAVVADHQTAFEHLARAEKSPAIARRIERHHHAVHGLLIEEAIATATFYATDLRELAIRLSGKRQWNEAASIYRTIVERDPTDAYAWEYLGYNLVRSQSHAQPTKHVEEIVRAYTRAHELDPTNPLYHGRLLGFRGRLGQDIKREVERWLGHYTWNGADRFASEVLKGLRRGRHDQVAGRLIAGHPSLLKHPEVKRIMDERWGRSLD